MENELPPNAKMVFKGKLFEIWQWEQKVFDGSIEIYEKAKLPNSTEVIAVVGDKIIIQDEEHPHRPKFLSLPGGRCEEGETPLDGAKRELLEETGYVSDDWILLRERRPMNNLIWTSFTFIARDCRRVAEPHLDAGERVSSSFVSFDEFIEISQRQDFRDKDLAMYLVRAKFDLAFKEELRKTIFG